MRPRFASSEASAPLTSACTASRSLFTVIRSSGLPHVVDVHLDGPNGKACEPADLVADPVANRGRDLREVQPVLDDDVQVDRDVVSVAAYLDAARRPVRQPFPAGHGDDAVALAGGLSHDACDHVARDRDPTE